MNSPLVEEVIQMAKASKEFLSEDQLNDIIEFGPKMTEAELEELKGLLVKIANQSVKTLEMELLLQKEIAEHYRANRRKEMEEKEKKEHAAEEEAAEKLIDNL